MVNAPRKDFGKKQSIHALEATNFFLADVQTCLGPFLAAYLAGAGWEPGRVGVALTLGGIITVAVQTPAGAIVDQLRSKKSILVLASAVLAVGALLLSISAAPWAVYTSQVLVGAAGPFLGPTLAAVTMGVAGVTIFDRQFGKNQSFNSGGNVACALLIAGMSHLFGDRAIFITAALLTLPTVLSICAIRSEDIDYDLARGGARQDDGKEVAVSAPAMVKTLSRDQVLLAFLACAFLFHFANAAMLPQLGEMLSHGTRSTAAPFMSACIIVTQVVIMLSGDGHRTICQRAWVWSETPVTTVEASLGRCSASLARIPGSNVWQGRLNTNELAEGVHSLRAIARTVDGVSAEDEIRFRAGARPCLKRMIRDQDNQIGAWPEHGLLGTQLGPNKNGRKW
jgi:hypothetical protein